jgi:hypothetical protein
MDDDDDDDVFDMRQMSIDNTCACNSGYKKNNDTVDQELFSCSTCMASGTRVAWRDGSGCTTCDLTVSRMDLTDRMDCRCGTTISGVFTDSNAIVAEFDLAGKRLSQKTCLTCPTWGYRAQSNTSYHIISSSWRGPISFVV